MIRTKDIPFLNGGEINVIVPSWKIRVRPLLVTYPNGTSYGVNKSTVIDLSEVVLGFKSGLNCNKIYERSHGDNYRVDVEQSERWVTIYFDNEDKVIKTFGDIQNFSSNAGYPPRNDLVKLFHNKQIFILGDVKIQHGLEYLKHECITYERRCAFMLSSSNIFVDGTWVSDYVQGWNDGTMVFSRDGMLDFPFLKGGSGIVPQTSDMLSMLYYVDVVSFTSAGSDVIVFSENPRWPVDKVFYVTNCHDARNFGSYKVVSSVGVSYTVQKIMAPAMVSDSVPVGFAVLAGCVNMNSIYANVMGENYIKLIMEPSVSGIKVERTPGQTVFSRANHVFYVTHNLMKYIAVPELSRCHSADTPVCRAPDTSMCGSSNDWSIIATEDHCFTNCDAACQVTYETICGSTCETVCDCAREGEGTKEPHCHYLDYDVIPVNSIIKCNSIIQTPLEDGHMCISCDIGCNTAGCHTPTCSPSCDLCQPACDANDTCTPPCQLHEVCAPCQVGCDGGCDNTMGGPGGGGGSTTVWLGPGGSVSGKTNINIDSGVICKCLPYVPILTGLTQVEANVFISNVEKESLKSESYSMLLGRSASSILQDLANVYGSVAVGISRLILQPTWDVMIAGVKSCAPSFSFDGKYLERVGSDTWDATNMRLFGKFKIKNGLDASQLIDFVTNESYRRVTVGEVVWQLVGSVDGQNLNISLTDWAQIFISGSGITGVVATGSGTKAIWTPALCGTSNPDYIVVNYEKLLISGRFDVKISVGGQESQDWFVDGPGAEYCYWKTSQRRYSNGAIFEMSAFANDKKIRIGCTISRLGNGGNCNVSSQSGTSEETIYVGEYNWKGERS
jgi:hypothetical protein